MQQKKKKSGAAFVQKAGNLTIKNIKRLTTHFYIFPTTT